MQSNPKDADPKNIILSRSPSTGEILGEVPITSREQAAQAIESARVAARQWGETDFREREKVLKAANDYIYKHFDRIAKLISDENGKSRVEAVSAEITPAMYTIKHLADNARRILSDEPISMFLWGLAGKTSTIHYLPWGVIGIISPWNYPFGIPMTQLSAALVAGNAVVLKPSSSTPLIGEMINEIWAAAGLPADVLSVIQGPGPLGEVLIEQRVDRLVFTGSVEIGRHVARLAADKLIPLTLELGGKDPAIVLEDADLEAATSGILWGAMANAGQTCASIERVYVHDSIFEPFVELITKKARSLRVGPDRDFDTDVGAITSSGQLRIIEQQVEQARAAGATVLCGGDSPQIEGGRFFPPTIIIDVDHTMPVMAEETFGPLLPIMRFTDVEQAIELANDSPFGLSASVWTADIARGKGIARKLRAGTVTLNDSLYTYGLAETPWGGIKDSGYGRTHGRDGLLEMARPLHVASDRFFKMKKPWWYPYNRELYDSLKRGLAFLTGVNIGKQRSAGLFKLIKSFSPKSRL
ncbi:MAG: aldehyde dehydrogenase family protein [Candidatus Alcyoniella australis]|nr:aldehyde dehydrogenase family protein [Candidatus Alcyoniella australis]